MGRLFFCDEYEEEGLVVISYRDSYVTMVVSYLWFWGFLLGVGCF